jgi:hypothetical protein
VDYSSKAKSCCNNVHIFVSRFSHRIAPPPAARAINLCIAALERGHNDADNGDGPLQRAVPSGAQGTRTGKPGTGKSGSGEKPATAPPGSAAATQQQVDNTRPLNNTTMAPAAVQFAVLGLARLGTARAEMQLRMLPAGPGRATCTDGSPVGYHFEPSASGQRTQFVIWLKGGSACWSYEGCVDRKTDKNHDGAGALGSSNHWPQTITGVGIQNTNPTENPDFHDYNMVYLEYCSGDQWRGTQLEPMNPWGEGSETFAFAGHLHLSQVVDHVLEGITPTEVILTGGSAGGVGAFVNADWLASRLPASTKFAAMPMAGFGAVPDTEPAQHWQFWSSNSVDPDPMEHGYFGWMGAISTLSVPAIAKCIADPSQPRVPWPGTGGVYPKEYVCIMTGAFYQYTEAAIHVSQCSVDREQAFNQGGAPFGVAFTNPQVAAYVEYCRVSQTTGLTTQVINGPKKATDGLFSPACMGHVNETGWFGTYSAPSQHVDGLSHAQAFSDWYFGRGDGNHMHLDERDSLVQLCSCSQTGLGMTAAHICGPPPVPSAGGHGGGSCVYASPAEVLAALPSFGCDISSGLCDAACAQAALPVIRKCRALPCGAACTQTTLPTMTTFFETCTAVMEAGINGMHAGQNAGGPAGGQEPVCDTTALYGTMLECNTWTTAAMADGVITLDDGFCTSTCHDHAIEVQDCSGHMTTEMASTFIPLIQLVRECQMTTPTITCDIARVQYRCGDNIDAASAACRHNCLNALDSERLLCAQDPTYLAYVPIKAACAGATARAQCANTASSVTTMTDSVCCVDQDCTDLPAECTPECAATFMPFFSRCGMQIFGADPTTLAKFQGFERKCANAVGRDVDLAVALGGPDAQDPCSANTHCSSCMGSCGWCRNEISDIDVLKHSGGGWCASECVTTEGECATSGHR